MNNCIRIFLRLFIVGFFFITCLKSKAQCYEDFYAYQLYPYGQLCYPQNVTLQAEYFSYNSGEFRWYLSDTDPFPVHTGYIEPDFGMTTSSYTVYATNGFTIWVSFYNYNTGCESFRQPYSFYIGTPAYVYQDYAKKCGYDIARVQMSSNTSGVTFQLYKLYEYYDPWYGWVQDYQYEQGNTTGYFEIWDFDPYYQDKYYVKLYQPYGCSTPYYYQLYFDITGPEPPAVSGNFVVTSGSSTTITASGTAYTFRWYDLAGNQLYEGWQYTTPTTLTPNNYTYQVRGVSMDGTCLTDPTTFTITVDYPTVAYTPLYNSSNFSRTIDLSKPVGKIEGVGGSTASGASAYSIPVYVSPATNGAAPSVSIVYNSLSGNGLLGRGWNLNGLSAITRSGRDLYHDGIVKPVSFTSSDAFLLDGKRLNPFIGNNGGNGSQYVCEEESFGRVFSWTGSVPDQPVYFEAYTKDRTLMEFGKTSDSRIMSEDGSVVMFWRVNRITDANGNYIDFVYDNAFRDSRIKTIKYTGNTGTGLAPYNTINFYYKNRTDKNSVFENGSVVRSNMLLDKITVLTEGVTTKEYQFNYGFDGTESFLKEVVETGSDASALNSTIFLYGDQPQSMNPYTTISFTGEPGSGDFNGDGKSDILATYYYYDNGIRYNSGYKIITDPVSWTSLYEKTLPAGHIVVENKKLANFLTSDFNQDGRDDILIVKTAVVTFPSGNVRRKVESYNIVYSKNTGGVEGQLPGGSRYIHESGNFLFPGDFDGDGNQDFITILATTTPSGGLSYKGMFNSPALFQMGQQIYGFALPGSSYPESVAEASKIIPVDFNGDRKFELLIIKGSQSYVMSVDFNAGSWYASIVYTTSAISSSSRPFPGDFNGDGKTDILVRNSNGSWNILYSTGTAFVATGFSFNQSVYLSGNYDEHKIVVSDFNGDGKSDILHGYNYQSTAKLSFYYSQGFDNSFLYEQLSHGTILPYIDLTVGDFNGDGRSDILSKNSYTGFANIYYLKPFGTERLMAKVTDGFNVTTSFNYKLMTDKSEAPYVYNRTVSLDDPMNTGAFNYIQLPLHLVSSIITPNGVGSTRVTEFTYEDAILHRTGKGFLGFKKMNANDIAKGWTEQTENALNTQFAALYTTRSLNYHTFTTNPITESIITSTFQDLSTSTYNKRFFHKTDKVLSIDHLRGTATEVSNVYDSWGNITTKTTKVGAPSGTTVSALETTTVTTTYGTHNTLFPAKPETSTMTQQRTGMPAINTTTNYSYNNKGLVSTRTEFVGLPKAVTSTYTYDGYGNPLTATVTATGVSTLTTSFSYDPKGRFAISKQLTSGGTALQTESFTYDSKWGVPLSSSSCYTTQYEYDAFGRLKKTTDPVFTANHSLVWDVQGENVYYSYTDYLAGRPDSKVWYDRLGREIKKQTTGFNNQWITNTISYDQRGNLASESNAYYSTETPLITSRTYNIYNQLEAVYNSLNTIMYTYQNMGGGNYKTVTSDMTGQTTSKTTDATGKVTTSSDKGGDLYFSYDSRGMQIEVKHGSTVMSTTTYDSYGRQLTVTDKNAGTVSYEYNAMSQLVSQTDNAGHNYQMTYDALGRILTRQGPEGTTTYEYYPDNAAGCASKNLKKINGFNNVVMEYTYDNLKRLTSEKATIDGILHTTQYGYDAYSNINKITYPSGVEVNNVYDNNGQLYIVTGGNPGQQTTLFYGNQMNGFDRFTSYWMAGKTTQVTYQYGVPTRYYTPGVQDLNLSWDFTRGNLSSRQDAIKGRTETFQYDQLNRLTQSSVNGQVQVALNYDGTSTFSMGNITSKSDAGNYTYRNDKIHAVAYLTGSSAISNSAIGQTATYTPFLKVASLGEDNQNQLTFTYGPDYERVKTQLTVGGSVSETRYFVGNYEKLVDGSGTREIHYVTGGNGICAIIVRQNGVNNFFATYTDHLSSILTVTDVNGNVVAEQNFDAWGRKRNVLDWSYNGVQSVPSWLYRGYTGHEHLPQFALINMNGRLYDPIQGRMLSPDNYVPNPFSTQGYNRYGYALNNPLSYIDPDGNFPWLVVAIAAAVFATGNTIAHAINGDIDNFGDGLRYFFQGAVVGAAVGIGIGFGMQVPFLAKYIIPGAKWIFIGSTALSVTSGMIQSIATGDIAPLAHAGQIFLGNFYLDENRSFFGGIVQGVSRFSWELVQTTVGHMFAQIRNSVPGGVDDVQFFGGATLVNRNNPGTGPGGMTLGNYILGTNLQANLADLTFLHEYGHTSQSRVFGVLYPLIAIVSGFSCAARCNDLEAIRGGFNISRHDISWYEMQANRYAARYFRKFYGVTWNDNANPRRWP